MPASALRAAPPSASIAPRRPPSGAGPRAGNLTFLPRRPDAQHSGRYPDRILPKTAEAAVKLKERTPTSLYNERPRWLADAHEALDRAVAAAYGWPEDISPAPARG